MRRSIILIILVCVVLAGFLVWNLWDRGPGSDELQTEVIYIEVDYQHSIIELRVAPGEAAQYLEIAIDPPLQFDVEREDGLVRVVLADDWQFDEEYILEAGLPEDGEYVLDAPFHFQFHTPVEPAFDLTAVGDVMLDQLTRQRLRDFDVNYPFARIKHITGSGNLNFANLEAPISDRGVPMDKTYVFRAPSYSVEALNIAGFNLVSLANNHILDYGVEAMLDTMAILAENGIDYIGAGANAKAARQGVMLDIDGVQVAVLAYTRAAPSRQYPSWAATEDKPGTVFYYDEERMIEALARARADADVVIISMHWGNEYTYQVNAEQKRIGHLLIDAGADLILGHHSHTPQGIEFYNGKPIVYSMGNFVFYPFTIDICNDAFILKARIGLGGVEEMRLVPVLVGDSQPYVPYGPELDRLHRLLGSLLEDFGTGYVIDGDEIVIIP